MHEARLYFSRNPNLGIDTPLNSTTANEVGRILTTDAFEVWNKGVLTFLDAINSACSSSYGWAVVKCYYATLYLLIAEFCLEEMCICHTPRDATRKKFGYGIIKARPGEVFSPLKTSNGASSHGAPVELSKTHLPTTVLRTQSINGDDAIEWLKSARESVNYRHPLLNIDDHQSLFTFLAKKEDLWPTLDLLMDKANEHYCFLDKYACFGVPTWMMVNLACRLSRLDKTQFSEALNEASRVGSPYRNWSKFKAQLNAAIS